MEMSCHLYRSIFGDSPLLRVEIWTSNQRLLLETEFAEDKVLRGFPTLEWLHTREPVGTRVTLRTRTKSDDVGAASVHRSILAQEIVQRLVAFDLPIGWQGGQDG
jgi:hypothetical protein